jgi:hypothetical protein
MRIPHAVVALLIAGACGGKPTSSATLGNAGGTPPTGVIRVTAVDSTGGKHEDAIKAIAEKHVAALAHARDIDALDLTLTLTSVDVATTVDCHVRIVVQTATDHAVVASDNGGAKVQAGPHPDVAAATNDCIDGIVSSLIDSWLARLVNERAGYDQPPQTAP